ncbi:VOC family protein [Brevibacillus sp. SKDU10]|uniref:VOC family protein n=1 Tax=Brevibacillus sp. SKDU10 TaxID=1247872 RepID=UPI000AED1A21|nr:hypothetical protein [Brevibacillus sp. SKDU10]
MNLEIASVGNFLLLSGSEKALAPFKATIATLVIDSLDEFAAYFKENGFPFIRKPKQVPTGKNMTVQHLDGAIVEYVEHSR